MCVGEPFRILSVDGIAAMATNGPREALIDLSLTGPVAPGTWVLTFLGTAREVISEDEARHIAAALAALRSVMTGGDVGDAFADLEATGPRLPPHLQAALAEGREIA
ncbi:HypC/HybG/HupF family hydrogenase formation chaperone [Rubellimicrobium arenae]|uniref:HypC/HybG/HupF family hydrogenase formation chaperone n=1 Tax=Rubellimicrobium arenae TaxID=2817372 RepID=UPI001B309E43|nr:HypC/HybG/HupF family hydrogenase formation chaperone [Rubellimicrobium arenae]